MKQKLLLLISLAVSFGSAAQGFNKIYGGYNLDGISGACLAIDGGIVTVGGSGSTDGTMSGATHYNGSDAWVQKLNPDGTIQWQTVLGGANGESFSTIRQTSDGGYIIVGGTSSSGTGSFTGMTSYGAQDCWVVKLDGNGALQWQKRFGGSGQDIGAMVHQTSDGGYIVVGRTASSDGTLTGVPTYGPSDAWVMKLDASGNIEWQKLYGGTDSDWLGSIQQTSDGGYIMTGSTFSSNSGTLLGVNNHGNSDCWIMKVDNLGTIQWQKLYGTASSDNGGDIQQTADGGYILATSCKIIHTGTQSPATGFGEEDYWILKLAPDGSIQWQRILGGSAVDVATSVALTQDGGYIIGGHSYSSNTGTLTGLISHGQSDAWLVKLDATGTLVWQDLAGHSRSDFGSFFLQTANGDYVMGGRAQTSTFMLGTQVSDDGWVRRFSIAMTPLPVRLSDFRASCLQDKSTSIRWSTAQEQNSSYFEVQKSLDGLAWTVIHKIEASGDSQTEKNYRVNDAQGGVALYRLKMVDQNGHEEYSGIARTSCQGKLYRISLYPVPADNVLNIVIASEVTERTRLRVFDQQGRLVMTVPVAITPGVSSFKINTQHLPPGHYVIRTDSEKLPFRERFAVVR